MTPSWLEPIRGVAQGSQLQWSHWDQVWGRLGLEHVTGRAWSQPPAISTCAHGLTARCEHSPAGAEPCPHVSSLCPENNRDQGSVGGLQGHTWLMAISRTQPLWGHAWSWEKQNPMGLCEMHPEGKQKKRLEIEADKKPVN